MTELQATSNQEASNAVLAVALTTTATVLCVEALHIPEAYIALSTAASLALTPTPSFHGFLFRLASVTLGVSSGVLLITALPESPWIYFFLVGLITAVGYHFFLKHFGIGTAYAFSAYFAAMCIKGMSSISSSHVVVTAINLLSQATIPIIVTYGVDLILKRKTGIMNHSYLKSPLASMTSIGLVVSLTIIVAFSIEKIESMRLVIASISAITTLEIERSSTSFIKQMLGYIFGAICSIAYIVALVAWTNDVAIYLLSLGCCFGFFEWLAHYYPNQKILLRALAIMFSYSVLMLPAPDSHLNISLARIVASLSGFSIAIIIFLVIEEVQKITRFMIGFKTERP